MPKSPMFTADELTQLREYLLVAQRELLELSAWSHLSIALMLQDTLRQHAEACADLRDKCKRLRDGV